MRRLNLTEEEKYNRMVVALLVGGTLKAQEVRQLAGLTDEGSGSTGAAWNRLADGPMMYRFGPLTHSLNMLSDRGWRLGLYLIRRDKGLAQFARLLQKAFDEANGLPNRIEAVAATVPPPTHHTAALAFLAQNDKVGALRPYLQRRFTSPNPTYARVLKELEGAELVTFQQAVNARPGHIFWDQYTLTARGRLHAERASTLLGGNNIERLVEAKSRPEVVVVAQSGRTAVLSARAQRLLLAFDPYRSPMTGREVAAKLGITAPSIYRSLYELAGMGLLRSSEGHRHASSKGLKPFAVTPTAMALIHELGEMTHNVDRVGLEQSLG